MKDLQSPYVRPLFAAAVRPTETFCKGPLSLLSFKFSLFLSSPVFYVVILIPHAGEEPVPSKSRESVFVLFSALPSCAVILKAPTRSGPGMKDLRILLFASISRLLVSYFPSKKRRVLSRLDTTSTFCFVQLARISNRFVSRLEFRSLRGGNRY